MFDFSLTEEIKGFLVYSCSEHIWNDWLTFDPHLCWCFAGCPWASVQWLIANRLTAAWVLYRPCFPQATTLKSFFWADTAPCCSLGLLCCWLTVMALPSATSPTPHRGLLTGEGDGSLAVVLPPLSKHSRSLTWHFPLVPISRHSYLWPLTFDVHWLTSCLFFLFFTFWLDRNMSSYSFSRFFPFFLLFSPLLFTTFNFNKWFVHLLLFPSSTSCPLPSPFFS